MSPTADNILLEPIEKKVTNLIILPKYAHKHKEFLSGRVFKVGPKVTQVSPGDEVAYAKDTGIEIELQDHKFVAIKPKHILAVV